MTREPLADVKFKKPKDMTRHGFPLAPRTPKSEKAYSGKYCNMSMYVVRPDKSVHLFLVYTSRMCVVMECR